MRRLAGVIVLAALAVAPAVTQPPVRIWTTPTPPTREVLDRLNLTLAWRVKLPTEGRRDGFASIQLVPGKGNNQIFVQTLRGLVLCLDAETGDTLWSTPVGLPYQA